MLISRFRNGYSSTGVNTNAALPPEPPYSPLAPPSLQQPPHSAAVNYTTRPYDSHSQRSSFAYTPHRFDQPPSQPSTAAGIPMAPLARAENGDHYAGDSNGVMRRRPSAPNFTTDPAKLKGELITTRLYRVSDDH